MGEQTTDSQSGFDMGFLTAEVAFPEFDAALESDLAEVEGSPRIPYTHFTVALSKSRKLARWVGWNINGGAMKLLSRSSLSFKLDPRIPAEFQTGNELYAGNRLDRGHIARRADLTWGDEAEAQHANADSFFFTNISPQMEGFNQSRQGGLWGGSKMLFMRMLRSTGFVAVSSADQPSMRMISFTAVCRFQPIFGS